MKLYICLTTYHMLAACALALKDKGNNSELLIEGFVDDEPELVNMIRESHIFKQVYYINQADAWTEINKLDRDSYGVQIFEAAKSVVRFWTGAFEHFQKIDKRYSDINIWDDHFTLGLALAYLKIPYNYFEESPGCHYRRDVFIQLSKDYITNKAFAPISEQFGLRGKNPYAKRFYYDFSLNPMQYGDKDRDFCLVRELKYIKESTPKYFELLKQIFAPNGYFKEDVTGIHDKEKENFLLVGQHYSVSTYSNINMIRYVLSLLVDYFGDDMNLWAKNHPSNYFNPFETWFPDANIIVDKVPLELIIADGSLQFGRVAAISSSAPLVMKEVNTDVILFQNAEDGDSFESKRRFLDLHRYYVIVKLIEKIANEKNIESFYTCGIETLSLQFLSKYQATNMPVGKVLKHISDVSNIKKESNDIRCFLIDCIEEYLEDEKTVRHEISKWLSSCDKNDLVFFVNSSGENIFFDVNNCESVEYLYPLPFDILDRDGNSGLFGYGNPEYPLKNTVEKLHQESYMDISNRERQIVYMYTKNEEITKLLLSYHVEKKLEHCGIEVVYNPTSINYRELVFESMLEQLEEQYIVLQKENIKLKENVLDNSANAQLAQSYIVENQGMSNEEVLNAINASSTMLMDRLTEIDGRVIRLMSWQGLKQRIKEKCEKLFKN